MTNFVIAVDIGGSHISSMIVDTNQSKGLEDTLLSTKANGFGTADEIVQSWSWNIKQTSQSLPSTDSYKIAIAMPGPFDYEKGIFQKHPEGKFKSLAEKSFLQLLQPTFQEELVISYENDAACFGLGEACFGGGKSYKKCIGITLGTGMGCCFVDQQTIIKRHAAIPLGGELYYVPYNNGIADDYFSTRWFVAKAANDLSLKVSGVKELIALASPHYLQSLFKQFSINFYKFLLPYTKGFGAEVIIIGGNIAKAWNYFGEELNKLFSKNNIVIQPALLNEQAILLGAAKVFLQQKKS